MTSANEAAARSGLAASGAELIAKRPDLVVDGMVDLDALVGAPALADFTFEVLERGAL
jgi:hypothetical protein